MKKRNSGVLMHISSLPSNYGIGTFGKEAYKFVDFLVKTKQKYWQILPLTTTSYGDSPYQSFSAIAGNTNFIDLDLLVEEGYLLKKELNKIDFFDCENEVNYEKIFHGRREVFKILFERFKKDKRSKKDYEKFKKDNSFWLDDFSEFMAIKEKQDLKSVLEWDKDLLNRKKEKLDKYRKKLKEEIENVKILQYFFFKQWLSLKKYANDNKIKIIGDMPFYVAEDSVEMWTKPELFKKDLVAGCPPDAFSETGQLWGNPIYNWDIMEKQNYAWWIERIRESFKIYDVVRIDHFKGFSDYYTIKKGYKDAKIGKWETGPRIKLFEKIKEELGDLDIIAEDLGYMDENSIKLRDDTGFPGMKILQFAFYGDDSVELPHNHINNSVCYTGTHDNDVIIGWYENLPKNAKERLKKYTNAKKNEKVTDIMLRTLFSSVSHIAIATIQDLLDKDNSTRMNCPSTLGNNWKFRITKKELTRKVEKRLLDLTLTYNRENKELENTK